MKNPLELNLDLEYGCSITPVFLQKKIIKIEFDMNKKEI
jgi:hypothetical protein